MRRGVRRLVWIASGTLVVLVSIGIGARVYFQGRYLRAFAPLEDNRFEAMMAIVEDCYVPDGFVAREEEIASARNVATNNRGRLLRLTRMLEDPIAIPEEELVGSSSVMVVRRVAQVYLATAVAARVDGDLYSAIGSRLDLFEYASVANRGGLLMHAMVRQKLGTQALKRLDAWILELSREEKETLGAEFARVLRRREPYEEFILRESLWAANQMQFGKDPIGWLKQKRQLLNLYAESRERFEAFETIVYDIEIAFGLTGR